MNPVFAIPILVALACLYYVVRRIAKRREKARRRARRERRELLAPQSFAPRKTKRSEMRTDEDPTTVMERITDTRPPVDASRPTKK
ncbi:MAG TPA: hypothetical protein PLW68_07555 [Casimicrobiaceae bacterium]|nr:hypothetical protein [Casimicrobiaceae bacterium]